MTRILKIHSELCFFKSAQVPWTYFCSIVTTTSRVAVGYDNNRQHTLELPMPGAHHHRLIIVGGMGGLSGECTTFATKLTYRVPAVC